MSKIKLLAIAVFGLLFINIGLVAWLLLHKPSIQQQPPHANMQNRGPHGRGDLKNRIIETLQFSIQQQEQYLQLVQNHRATINTIDDSIVAVKNNLYALLQSNNSLAKKQYIEQLGILQKTIEETHYQHFAAIKQICTKEQLPLFENLVEQMATFFGNHKKMPPPPRGF